MIDITQAIHKLYPNVVRTVGSDNPIAYDANGNEFVYDIEAVTKKAKNDAQAIIDNKASALAKLSALGLTQDEVKALIS